MKIHNKIAAFLLLTFTAISLTGCYENEDPMYDVLGGVATIQTLTPSKLNPTAGEAMTVRTRYYSDKGTVTELRLYAKVGAADRALAQTVTVTGFDSSKSYEQVFNYTVPAGTPAATFIIFTVEVETEGDLFNTRSTPATGTSAVRTI